MQTLLKLRMGASRVQRTKQTVEAKQSDETEVAQHLVKGVRAKVTSNVLWILALTERSELRETTKQINEIPKCQSLGLEKVHACM